MFTGVLMYRERLQVKQWSSFTCPLCTATVASHAHHSLIPTHFLNLSMQWETKAGNNPGDAIQHTNSLKSILSETEWAHSLLINYFSVNINNVIMYLKKSHLKHWFFVVETLYFQFLHQLSFQLVDQTFWSPGLHVHKSNVHIYSFNAHYWP